MENSIFIADTNITHKHNLDDFNSSVDEIMKKFFSGYNATQISKIVEKNIVATETDMSNEEKAEITYVALQRRKWANKRRRARRVDKESR